MAGVVGDDAQTGTTGSAGRRAFPLGLDRCGVVAYPNVDRIVVALVVAVVAAGFRREYVRVVAAAAAAVNDDDDEEVSSLFRCPAFVPDLAEARRPLFEGRTMARLSACNFERIGRSVR